MGMKLLRPIPVMFLVAHSIELALKSYLRSKGAAINDLKGLGHNLARCWEKAVKNGIEQYVVLTEEDLDILKLIGRLHLSTELRYIRTGFKTFPVFGSLEALARQLLDTICPLVGYP